MRDTSCSAPRRFGKSLFLSTLRHYYNVYGEGEMNKMG
ncbi:MAG: hypothetical protein D3916_04345 [Candidatus Electrothrix sp. MAN1_4]|nr:hypothetical protein [Candidatus Electrothrix sp. MAN1_4]